MNGQLLGDFRIHRLIQTSDGEKWMMQDATWDVSRNTISGTWFNLDYGTAGVSASPVKIKVNPPGTEPTIDPAPPNGGITTNSPGLNINPAPTVIKPIAFNATTAKISKGANVTSITLEDAATGTEFLAGDGVTIVDPISGAFQTFNVSTPPGPGDTSITVTSEVADYDFPVGSYLVVKQNAYSFRLPQGTAEGQILRWDDTNEVWEVYSGSTDGHVLTWDTTNGWQSEAATGGGLADGDYGDISVSGGGTVLSIDAGVVDTTELANFAVTTIKLASDSVTFVKIVDGAVITSKIADLNITTGKLADGAVITSKIADLNITTGKIANDAVTYAKIQNVSTNNRILGRITAGAGDVEELTPANMQTILGYIDGALTNPRIPYASDANTLTDTVNLRWLDGTQEIMISGGASLDARFSHRATANITGDSKLIHGENNVSGTYDIRLVNTRNVSNTGNSRLILQTGGASAGDPFILFVVSSASNDWAVGVDNTDSDKFKITPKATAPGSVANSGLIIRSEAAARVGINKDNPAHPLDVEGIAQAHQFRNHTNAWTAGNIVFGTGAGTGPAVNDIVGGVNGFRIRFTTGTTPTNNGDIFTATYPTSFGGESYVTMSGRTTVAYNDERAKFYVSAAGANSFTLKANGTLTASKEYHIQFTIFGITLG
jgi:hypothetical protein